MRRANAGAGTCLLLAGRRAFVVGFATLDAGIRRGELNRAQFRLVQKIVDPTIEVFNVQTM